MAPDPDVVRTLGLDRDDRPRRRRWWVALGLVSLLASSAVAAGRTGAAPPAAYRTAPVTRGSLEATVQATGTLQPTQRVEVGPEVSGRIVHVHADFDDRVQRDQLLAEIDRQPLEVRRAEAGARLMSAQAALQSAHASRGQARSMLGRVERLAPSGSVAAHQVDDARATLERAEASVQDARAQIALARSSLDAVLTDLARSSIRSPIDGVVLRRSAEPGQAVAATFNPPILFVIAGDLSTMQLHLDVDEADIGRVEPGQRARFTVDAHPDRSFPATVVSVRNDAQRVQGVVSYEVLLTVDNREGLLRPGMTATARLITGSSDSAALVPAASLRFRPRDAKRTRHANVWVLRSGVPVAVAVERRLDAGDQVAVSGPLRVGDSVIVGLRSSRRRTER